jgi:hypothetical protein
VEVLSIELKLITVSMPPRTTFLREKVLKDCTVNVAGPINGEIHNSVKTDLQVTVGMYTPAVTVCFVSVRNNSGRTLY